MNKLQKLPQNYIYFLEKPWEYRNFSLIKEGRTTLRFAALRESELRAAHFVNACFASLRKSELRFASYWYLKQNVLYSALYEVRST